MKLEVKAVKHADIRGKELLYLILNNGKEDIVINIGEKTFNLVEAMTKQAIPDQKQGGGQ